MHEKSIPKDRDNKAIDLGVVRQVVGSLDGTGMSVGIVVSRFNESLTEALVRSAIDGLTAHGVAEESIEVVWVPGAFEVPPVIRRLAQRGGFTALIALGVVIEGETPHADLINHEVTRGLGGISREFGLPVIHEVVGTRNLEQAVARCTSGRESRGWYAALAAIETARVFEELA